MFVVVSTIGQISHISKATATTKAQARKFVESYGSEVEAVYSKRQWDNRNGNAYFSWDFETDFGRVMKCASLTQENAIDIELHGTCSVSELAQESGITCARKILKEHCRELGLKLIDITPRTMAQDYRLAVIDAINETR